MNERLKGKYMRIGVMLLPEWPWIQAQNHWRLLDDLGFHSAWTLDHLWWRDLRDKPWFAPFPSLAAAATVTTRISLGTLVTTPNHRHPLVVAKDAATVADVSCGRFTLGVGAGSSTAGDANATNRSKLSAIDRTVRFSEYVEILDRFCRGIGADYRGEFYTVSDAPVDATQSADIRIAIAATTPDSQRIAARFADAWVTCGPLDLSRSYTHDEYFTIVRRQSASFSQRCEEIGRDPAGVDRILVANDVTSNTMKDTSELLDYIQKYMDLGITEIVLQWPRQSGIYEGDPSALEHVATHVIPELQGRSARPFETRPSGCSS